jgi:hypothetical protein
MGNKGDTTREAIDRRLFELQKKINDNIDNLAVSEEVFSQDLPKLNDMILQCDDLGVDPRKLAFSVDEYFRNLALQEALITPRSLLQFETDLMQRSLLQSIKDLQSSASHEQFGKVGEEDLFEELPDREPGVRVKRSDSNSEKRSHSEKRPYEPPAGNPHIPYEQLGGTPHIPHEPKGGKKSKK